MDSDYGANTSSRLKRKVAIIGKLKRKYTSDTK